MKKYKVILAAFVIISIVSCQSYKFVFAPTDGVIATKTFSKILKEDQLFLVFTKAYDNSKITVYENKIVLFDSIIPPPRKNITKVFKVNINSNITIHFDDIKKPSPRSRLFHSLVLNLQDLRRTFVNPNDFTLYNIIR
jgi:hypothetical protein